MGKPVVHWEVTGKDGKKLQKFYAGVFGWTIHDAPMDYGLVHAEKGGIGGGIGADPEGSGHVTFYVEVDDLAATLKAIESLGGKTLMPPTEVPGQVTFALFADPEGHMVGLVKSEQQ
ncbi:MAG: VOC family protein [Chloroflexi bacterium]|nr:VOC family protein [Chloroflexota bacterium]